MKNNISVIIGNNATYKTRYLKKTVREYLNNGIKVSHNLKGLQRNTEIDMEKSNIIDDLSIARYEELCLKTYNKYEEYVKSIYNTIISCGKILVIDELDYRMKQFDINVICQAISDMRDCWDCVIISGYSVALNRVFESEKYHEYTANYKMIDKDTLEPYSITEKQAYEYFDEL